jgi:protein CpxP
MKKLILALCLFAGITTAANAQTVPATTDPVVKAKELQTKLKLTDVQTAKVATIYQESAQKFDKIKAEEKGNNDKMLVKIRPLRTATIAKIKAVLKPAQIVEYEKLTSAKSKSSAGWSDGWSSTASN